jgi:hypothetical protein
MKNKQLLLLSVVSVFIGGIIFFSCEEDGSEVCEQCKLVVTNLNDSLIRETPIGQECGETLDSIKALDSDTLLSLGQISYYTCE